MSENTVNAGLRRLGYAKNEMTGHGFRSIASTLLNEQGWHRDAIKIKVAAPPVEGAANAELVRFVAERVGVTRGAVTIASGATARRKTVAVEGVTADALARALLHRD